ncbi:MAG: alkaline phosphatase [Thermodesulfobacteriota bacterium]
MKKDYSVTVTGFVVMAIFLVVGCFIAVNGNPAFAEDQLYQGKPAKYVFLFIGDGMGIPQRTAAETFTGKRLLMDTFPAQGITTTYAADRFITGSAASATALACGQKTNIGMIGMAPDQRHVMSIAEMARDQGMKVGIISSVSIDHATPAAFYAHVTTRGQYYDIAVALAESGFDFFGGGGIKDPTNKKKNTSSFRGDALEIAKANGYNIITNRANFMDLEPGSGKILAWNAKLPDGKALPYAIDTAYEDITLQEFTAKAIELLENQKGFFLMVEGGKIDWACHANDGTTSIKDTLAFDDAIKEAVAFAERHPRETLIVVTGDHECGGLTLGWSGTQYESHFGILGNQTISFQRFSDEILKGYKANCKGTCSFEDVQPMITRYFGLKFEGFPKDDHLVLEDYQIAMLRESYFRSMLGEKVTSKDPTTSLMYGEYEPLAVTITHILNNKAGLGWTSYKHTGVPVSTSATGPGAEIFNGYYDNTDVAKKLMSVMGIAAEVHFASQEQTLKIAVNE